MADMTIFGVLRNAASRQKALSSVPQRGGWWRISEPFAGAWQRNKEEDHGTVLTYPTLYTCITSIMQDIGKLPFLLMSKTEDATFVEVENPAYSPVLRTPNHYQNQQQFREAWLASKLIQGNTYVLLKRDERGVVNAMYPLDPFRVKPLVSDAGAVYYELQTSNLSLLPENGDPLIVPARDIIHDRWATFHHPLVGVPPLAAANWAVVKNLRIMRSAAEFFGNGAQPSGILTAPGQIGDETAKRLSDYWNTNFSGGNAGKVAVVGDDLKYMPMAMKSTDAQLVEQLKYSDEQIAQPFRIKPYKIGICVPPAGWKSDDVNVEYHSDALSSLIEAIENLLAQGLNINKPLQVWLDDETLWRMDAGKLAEVETKLVGGMIKTPDESRRKLNLPKTAGGDTLWGQHQDYPLGVLRNRNDLDKVEPAQPPAPAPADEDETKAALTLAQIELNTLKAVHAAREVVQCP